MSTIADLLAQRDHAATMGDFGMVREITAYLIRLGYSDPEPDTAISHRAYETAAPRRPRGRPPKNR